MPGYGDDGKEESDVVGYADSTMLINDDVTNPKVHSQRQIKRIQSVFERIDLDAFLPIP